MIKDEKNTSAVAETASEHTPGEWQVSSRFGSVGAVETTSKEIIAFPCSPRRVDEARLDGESWLDMHNRTDPARLAIEREKDANAHLLASAPNLLKAALAASHALKSYASGNSATDLAEEVSAFCDAAIAKATQPSTGETP